MANYNATFKVPAETLDTLNDAISVFEEKVGVVITQRKFFEYLFESRPEDIAQMALKNYREHVLKMKL